MMTRKGAFRAILALALIVGIGFASWAGAGGGRERAGARDAAIAVVMPPRSAQPQYATPRPTPIPLRHGALLQGIHHLVVRNPTGLIVAEFDQPQLVTTAGKNYLLNAGLANGTSAITAWYVGMLAENRHVNDAVTNGTTTLTSATASFVSGDAGRQLTVIGAGASGANLVTTIATYTNGTTVVMANAASNSASGQTASIGPLLAAADTAASHAGWSPIGSAYITNGSWPAWTAGTVSAGSVSNSGSPASFTMASAIATQYLHGLFLTSSSALATSSGTLYSEVEFTGGALAVGASYTVSDTYTLSLTMADPIDQFVRNAPLELFEELFDLAA